jgi:hypothetical protein
MKRKPRTVILFSLIALAITVIVSWPFVLRTLVERGLQEIKSSGTNISWEGLSTSGTSVNIDSLSIWFPGPRVKGTFAIPVSLELQRVSAVLKLASLLALSPTVSFSTQLYGGGLSGEAQPSAASTSLSANVENLEIGKHPQLFGIGVKGGTTNANLEDIKISPQGVEGGMFAFRVRELTPPTIEAVRTLLRTDDLGTIDLDAEGTISPTVVEVPSIRLSSIFGSVVGSLSISEHHTRNPAMKGTFDISLSENGVSTIGPWLQLIPGAGLDPSTSSFTTQVTSTPCSSSRGAAAVIRLPSGCLKLEFEKR